MSMYYLLPFRFFHLDGHDILVNEVGDYLVTEKGTVKKIVSHSVPKNGELYKDLVANYFISEKLIPDLMDAYAVRLRTKKSFLDHFTALHIFVLTLRCNQNCIYCQASSKNMEESSTLYDMSIENLHMAVRHMFSSPSPFLTMEFQGGESSLVPDLLQSAIEYAEEQKQIHQKKMTYVLCSNCRDLSDRILNLCSKYHIFISTSLDGPEYLHNYNRGKDDSYQKVIAGIQKARNYLGTEKVSALMTTSEYSLAYPKEIIDCYLENGFRSIFLRALNPYGLAAGYSQDNGYNDRFIDFYKKALDYILTLNRNGCFFVEEFTALILRKILTPFPIGFVDLQSPAGLINNVVVYHYDGDVYASDESRMLGTLGDKTFRLGHVSNSYNDLFYGEKARELASLWGTEFIAGCSDCAFQAYCGADPVRNYVTQSDMYGIRPLSSFCKKHKAIILYIFHLLITRKDEVMPIFQSWITGENCHD
jgi:paired radical SAM protein 1